jgi:hypothetical protein
MPFRPEKTSHVYRAEIRVKGPMSPAQWKSFISALRRLARGKNRSLREIKPKKGKGS